MRRRAETYSLQAVFGDFYQLRRLPRDAIHAGDEKKNIQDAQEAVPAEGHREMLRNA